MDRIKATLHVDGREVWKSNPLEQAKQYAFGAWRLLDSVPAPGQEVATGAKLLYADRTRAMERLHMTHHAKSVFVARLPAALGAGRGDFARL